ncbi:DUF6876 family protein [Microcoleus sp. B3-D7]|uniref:DUF6876 family protein n=1 Tax=Microcoleus sp. B3-D7 TaxID=2818659 RepID=UPI002FD39192
MLDAQQLQIGLQHCTGTTQYFKHSLTKLQYTEGIQYLAENAESYWLIDAIASYQHQLGKKENLKQFQVWLLIVGDDHKIIKSAVNHDAVLTCWEDTPKTGDKPVIRQDIPFTDFPLPEMKLYVKDSILMLPSEN